MTEVSYLHFSRLQAPVALEDAVDLLPMIADVFAKWPFSQDPSARSRPFVTLRPGGREMWALSLGGADTTPRVWNAVNVVCDLIAEMAWERLRSDPTLLCLHAAAVDFGGRLVVLPNARRAGKSTLAAALGRLGHNIFTDDFLPVSTGNAMDGSARKNAGGAAFLGLANGVAPRIRMPVPDGFSGEFKTWVKDDPGPSNSQYKYLLNCPVAQEGEELPLGAIVILDRQNEPCEMALDPIPVEQAISTLVSQNFARVQHAGTILKSIDGIAKHLPTFRLTYHCAEDAAQFLSTHAALAALPAHRHTDTDPDFRLAPLEQLGQVGQRFEASLEYTQSAGVTVSEAGDTQFLADGTGLSIYRLNAVSAAIWALLEEPIDLEEIVDILTLAFSDADPKQIVLDCKALMQNFAAARLITPAAASVAAQ